MRRSRFATACVAVIVLTGCEARQVARNAAPQAAETAAPDVASGEVVLSPSPAEDFAPASAASDALEGEVVDRGISIDAVQEMKLSLEVEAMQDIEAAAGEGAPADLRTVVGDERGLGAVRGDGKFRSPARLSERARLADSDGAMFDAPGPSAEEYEGTTENEFIGASQEPLSTFSIDVDTASYANVRRFLQNGQLPPREAVRIEEMVNYFRYDYREPDGEAPFSIDVEVAACPWNPEHRLARIGLMGKTIERDARPASNLVFLVDVSGSMNDVNKLPLVKTALRMLVEQLNANDRIAIVVYAGDARVALPSTPADRKQTILLTVDQMHAGGSTHGSAGIRDAYRIAEQNFIQGGTNRVILCTDGDFNVGTTDREELVDLIRGHAKSGVFLSVLGFGMGNYKDATLEGLADEGNGNYGYVDSTSEARKTFVEEMSGTLVTIAKDVKIQVDFNPGKVAAYRLVGYENRMLAKQDFKDDKKDAGEIGAGHCVTAFYEIVPAGMAVPNATPDVDPSKYVKTDADAADEPAVDQVSDENLVPSDELLTVRLRYKDPEGDQSKPLEQPVVDQGGDLENASSDFRFAAAVAAFGMRLRDSQLQGESDFDLILDLAAAGKDDDAEGRRKEFVGLVEEARKLEDR